MKKSSAIYILIPLILAPTLFLTGCGSSNTLELSGTIEATQTEVSSEVSGKVIKIEKQEGDSVRKGDVLAVLDQSMQEITVKQQQAVIDMKEAKLEELKAGSRPQQLEQAGLSVKSAGLAVNNASTNLKNAQTTYDYWLKKYEDIKKLHDEDTATDSEVADAKYKLDTSKQQLDIAEKQLDTQKTQLESAKAQEELLKSGSTAQTIKVAEADLEQSRLALEQAKLVLDKYQVRSPADGILSMENVSVGDLVNTGANVATVSDPGDLWVYVFVPQKYLADIANGQELNLRVKALGNGTVKGRVVQIAEKAEFTPKNTETEDAKENTVFRTKIKILEKTESLRPGMTLDAIIPLKG
ncbi:MAG TPA: HlyD family efflux transporter periplasmic adaptor subunit [Clostridia bacterium]|nr:HlyD family efflux transporter periplasmic adaptor subunit [Clostridia bacterium]